MDLEKKWIKSEAVAPIALSLLLGLWSIPAQAFIFIKGGAFNKGGRPVSEAPIWPSRRITFYVNTDLTIYGGSVTPELTSDQFLAAVKDAIKAWDDACDADIEVVYGGTTSSTDNSADDTNVITWDNRTTGEGNTFGASTSTLAAAATSVTSSNNILDCDIITNGNFSGDFGVNGESNKYDIISTLAHEVGHCLGIDHPVEPPTYTSGNSFLLESTMVQTAVAGIGSIFRRTINQDDIDAIICMYESGKSFRSGYSCGSYHGTSGGSSDISGNVSGGPSKEVTQFCQSDPAITFFTKGESGGGCITKAVAEDGRPSRGAPWQSGWFLEVSFMAAVLFVIRGIQKWSRNS